MSGRWEGRGSSARASGIAAGALGQRPREQAALGLSGCELLSDSVYPRQRALTRIDTGPLEPLSGPPWSQVGSSDPGKAHLQKQARGPVCQPLDKAQARGRHAGPLLVQPRPVSCPARRAGWAGRAGRARSSRQIPVLLDSFVHFCSLCASKLHPSSGRATPNLSLHSGAQLNLHHAVSRAQMGQKVPSFVHSFNFQSPHFFFFFCVLSKELGAGGLGQGQLPSSADGRAGRPAWRTA